MAELVTIVADTRFTFTATRASEVGEPPFTYWSVAVWQKQRPLLRTNVVAMLPGDLKDIILGLESLLEGIQNEHTTENIDGTFILSVDRLESQSAWRVAVWVGEPYEIMRGVRTAATREDSQSFVVQLAREIHFLLSTE